MDIFSAVDHLKTWCKIRLQFESELDELRDDLESFLKHLDRFSVDIDHSALLQRLTSGKNPLPTPPPTFYAYPCYRLFEDEHIPISAVSVNFRRNELYADQSRWTILNHDGWHWWLLQHRYGHVVQLTFCGRRSQPIFPTQKRENSQKVFWRALPLQAWRMKYLYTRGESW